MPDLFEWNKKERTKCGHWNIFSFHKFNLFSRLWKFNWNYFIGNLLCFEININLIAFLRWNTIVILFRSMNRRVICTFPCILLLILVERENSGTNSIRKNIYTTFADDDGDDAAFVLWNKLWKRHIVQCQMCWSGCCRIGKLQFKWMNMNLRFYAYTRMHTVRMR